MELRDKTYLMPTDELIDRLTNLFKNGMCLDLVELTGKRNNLSDDEKYICDVADYALDRVDLDELYNNADKLGIPEKYPEFYDFLESLQLGNEEEERVPDYQEEPEEPESDLEDSDIFDEEDYDPGDRAIYEIVNGQHTGNQRDSEKWVEKDRMRQQLTDDYNAMYNRESGNPWYDEWQKQTAEVESRPRDEGVDTETLRREARFSNWSEPEPAPLEFEKPQSKHNAEYGSRNVTEDLHSNNAGDVTHVVKGTDWYSQKEAEKDQIPEDGSGQYESSGSQRRDDSGRQDSDRKDYNRNEPYDRREDDRYGREDSGDRYRREESRYGDRYDYPDQDYSRSEQYRDSRSDERRYRDQQYRREEPRYEDTSRYGNGSGRNEYDREQYGSGRDMYGPGREGGSQREQYGSGREEYGREAYRSEEYGRENRPEDYRREPYGPGWENYGKPYGSDRDEYRREPYEPGRDEYRRESYRPGEYRREEYEPDRRDEYGSDRGAYRSDGYGRDERRPDGYRTEEYGREPYRPAREEYGSNRDAERRESGQSRYRSEGDEYGTGREPYRQENGRRDNSYRREDRSDYRDTERAGYENRDYQPGRDEYSRNGRQTERDRNERNRNENVSTIHTNNAGDVTHVVHGTYENSSPSLSNEKRSGSGETFADRSPESGSSRNTPASDEQPGRSDRHESERERKYYRSEPQSRTDSGSDTSRNTPPASTGRRDSYVETSYESTGRYEDSNRRNSRSSYPDNAGRPDAGSRTDSDRNSRTETGQREEPASRSYVPPVQGGGSRPRREEPYEINRAGFGGETYPEHIRREEPVSQRSASPVRSEQPHRTGSRDMYPTGSGSEPRPENIRQDTPPEPAGRKNSYVETSYESTGNYEGGYKQQQKNVSSIHTNNAGDVTHVVHSGDTGKSGGGNRPAENRPAESREEHYGAGSKSSGRAATPPDSSRGSTSGKPAGRPSGSSSRPAESSSAGSGNTPSGSSPGRYGTSSRSGEYRSAPKRPDDFRSSEGSATQRVASTHAGKNSADSVSHVVHSTPASSEASSGYRADSYENTGQKSPSSSASFPSRQKKQPSGSATGGSTQQSGKIEPGRGSHIVERGKTEEKRSNPGIIGARKTAGSEHQPVSPIPQKAPEQKRPAPDVTRESGYVPETAWTDPHTDIRNQYDNAAVVKPNDYMTAPVTGRKPVAESHTEPEKRNAGKIVSQKASSAVTEPYSSGSRSSVTVESRSEDAGVIAGKRYDSGKAPEKPVTPPPAKPQPTRRETHDYASQEPETYTDSRNESVYDRGTEKAPERVPEKSPERAYEKASEKASEEASEEASERASEKASEKAPEKAYDRAPEKMPESVSEKERLSEKEAGKTPAFYSEPERSAGTRPEPERRSTVPPKLFPGRENSPAAEPSQKEEKLPGKDDKKGAEKVAEKAAETGAVEGLWQRPLQEPVRAESGGEVLSEKKKGVTVETRKAEGKKVTGERTTIVSGKSGNIVTGKEHSGIIQGKDNSETIGRGAAPGMIKGREDVGDQIISGRATAEKPEKAAAPTPENLQQKNRNKPKGHKENSEGYEQTDEKQEQNTRRNDKQNTEEQKQDAERQQQTAPKNNEQENTSSQRTPESSAKSQETPVREKAAASAASGLNGVPVPEAVSGRESAVSYDGRRGIVTENDGSPVNPWTGEKYETREKKPKDDDRLVSGRNGNIVTGNEFSGIVGGKNENETVGRGAAPGLVTGRGGAGFDGDENQLITGRKTEKTESHPATPPLQTKTPQKGGAKVSGGKEAVSEDGSGLAGRPEEASGTAEKAEKTFVPTGEAAASSIKGTQQQTSGVSYDGVKGIVKEDGSTPVNPWTGEKYEKAPSKKPAEDPLVTERNKNIVTGGEFSGIITEENNIEVVGRGAAPGIIKGNEGEDQLVKGRTQTDTSSRTSPVQGKTAEGAKPEKTASGVKKKAEPSGEKGKAEPGTGKNPEGASQRQEETFFFVRDEKPSGDTVSYDGVKGIVKEDKKSSGKDESPLVTGKNRNLVTGKESIEVAEGKKINEVVEGGPAPDLVTGGDKDGVITGKNYSSSGGSEVSRWEEARRRAAALDKTAETKQKDRSESPAGTSGTAESSGGIVEDAQSGASGTVSSSESTESAGPVPSVTGAGTGAEPSAGGSEVPPVPESATPPTGEQAPATEPKASSVKDHIVEGTFVSIMPVFAMAEGMTANFGMEVQRDGNLITLTVDGEKQTFTIGEDGRVTIKGKVFDVYEADGKSYIGYKDTVMHGGVLETPGGEKFKPDKDGKILIDGCPDIILVSGRKPPSSHDVVDIVAEGRKNGNQITVKVNGKVKTFTIRSDGTIAYNGMKINVYKEGDSGKVWIGWKDVTVEDGVAVTPDGRIFRIGSDGKVESNDTGLNLETFHGVKAQKIGESQFAFSGSFSDSSFEFDQNGNVFIVNEESFSKMKGQSVFTRFGGGDAVDGEWEPLGGTGKGKAGSSGGGPSGGGGPGGGASGDGAAGGGSGAAGAGGAFAGGFAGKKAEKLDKDDINNILKRSKITRTLDKQGRIMHVMMGNDAIQGMYDIDLTDADISSIVGHYDDILAANCENYTQFAKMNSMLEDKFLSKAEISALRSAEKKLKEVGLPANVGKLKEMLNSKKLTQLQEKAVREYIELYEKTREKIIKDGILVFSAKNKNTRVEHTFYASAMLVLLREKGLPTDLKALKKLLKKGSLTADQEKMARNAIRVMRSLKLYEMSKRGLQKTVRTVKSAVNRAKLYASKYMGNDYTMRGLLMTTSILSAIIKTPFKAYKAVKKAKALKKMAVRTGKKVLKMGQSGIKAAKTTVKTARKIGGMIKRREVKQLKKAARKGAQKATHAVAKATVKAVKMMVKVIVQLLKTIISTILSMFGPIVLILLFVLLLVFSILAFVSDKGDTVYYDAGDEDTALVIQEMVDVLTLCNNTFKENLSSQFGTSSSLPTVSSSDVSGTPEVSGTPTPSAAPKDKDATGVDDNGDPQLQKGDSSDIAGKYNIKSSTWWSYEFGFDQQTYATTSTQHTLHQMIVDGKLTKSNNGGYLFLNNSMYAAAVTSYWGDVGDVLKVEFDKSFKIGSQPETNVMNILIVDIKDYDDTGYPGEKDGLYGHYNPPGGSTRDFAEFTGFDGVKFTDTTKKNMNLNVRGIIPKKATNMGNILNNTCDVASIGNSSSTTNASSIIYYWQDIDQDVYRDIINREKNIYYTFPEEQEVPEGLSPSPTPVPDDSKGEIYRFYNNNQELISMVLAMFDFDINDSTSAKMNTLIEKNKSGADKTEADDSVKKSTSDKLNDDIWRLITYFDENGLDLTTYKEGGYDDLRYNTLVALYNASHIVTWYNIKEIHEGPDGKIDPNTDGMTQREPVMITTKSTVTNADGTKTEIENTHHKTDASGNYEYKTTYAPCPGHLKNVAVVYTLHFDSLLNLKKWWQDNIYSAEDFEDLNPDYKEKDHVLKSDFQCIQKTEVEKAISGTCSVASVSSAFDPGEMTKERSDVAKIVYKYLKDTMHLSENVAMGLMVNIWEECKFEYVLNEVNGDGYGITQWSFERKVLLMQWCSSHSYGAYNTLEGQLAYLKAEFEDPTYISSAWTGSVSGFTSCTTIADASRYFMLYYERPDETLRPARLERMAGEDIQIVKDLLAGKVVDA